MNALMDGFMDGLSDFDGAAGAAVAAVAAATSILSTRELRECEKNLKHCHERLLIMAKKLEESVANELRRVFVHFDEKLEESVAKELRRVFVHFDEVTEAYEKQIDSLQAENEKLIQGYANSVGREINRNKWARLQDTIERGIYHPYVQGLEAENIQLRRGYANSARRQINRNKAVARIEDITERMNEDAAAGPDSGTIEY